jgi:putative ABC transport system ATP-binding protein
MLELNAVSKVFPGRNGQPVEALQQIDLSVSLGEFVTVIGPSGSGKSTLLFTIGGMHQPTKGEVVLGGSSIYSHSQARRTDLRRKHIGFVFQTFNLIPYLNCLENVSLPATLAGNTRASSVKKARDMLEELNLSHRLSHRPAELSVGERQRVAICRSLINDPELILADEPTGNLDTEMTEDVIRLLQSVHRDGRTLLVVTHDPQVALIGSKTLRMRNGKIEDQDEARQKGLVA